MVGNRKTRKLMRPFKIIPVLVMVWSSLACQALAESVRYEEGTHYVALDIPVKTRNSDVIEVMEYFSYACPHCYQMEPLIRQWKAKLPGDVVFKRTPAIWSDTYRFLAEVYFTAEALGVLERVHTPVFQAIHLERRPVFDPESMALLFSEQGVDPASFAKAFNSFGVRAARQQAEARGRAYRSKGVPAIVVNGKYRIETGMAGGNAAMLEVTDFLINRERALMKGVVDQPAG